MSGIPKNVRRLIIMLWIGTVVCLTLFFLSFPHYYCLFPLMMAILLPPVVGYQKIIKKIFPRKWIKPILLCILLLTFIACASSTLLRKSCQNNDIQDNNADISNAKDVQSTNEEIHAAAELEPLEIHFIDVGQGDATLLITDGHYMLIDGGSASSSSLIYSYLSKLAVDHLDYIVCTHPHEDHVGGLAGALNYCSADTAFCSVTEYDSRAFNSFLKYLSKHGVSLQIPEINAQYRLGDAYFTVIGPLDLEVSDINNLSLVIKVCHGENTFLLMADAEKEVENTLLENYADVDCSVIRIGHHGSNSSSSESFIDAVSPDIAVISVGKDNKYGHPSEEVLTMLNEKEIPVYRTDLCGDIIMVSDGKQITVNTEKTQTK